MGFFSKLFGKSEPENTQAEQQPAAPKPVQVNLDADKIISLLGGKDNIADIKTCAFHPCTGGTEGACLQSRVCSGDRTEWSYGDQ